MLLKKGKNTAVIKDGIGLLHTVFLKEDFGLICLREISREEALQYKKEAAGDCIARPVYFTIIQNTDKKAVFDFINKSDKTYEIFVDYYPHRKRA